MVQQRRPINGGTSMLALQSGSHNLKLQVFDSIQFLPSLILKLQNIECQAQWICVKQSLFVCTSGRTSNFAIQTSSFDKIMSTLFQQMKIQQELRPRETSNRDFKVTQMQR